MNSNEKWISGQSAQFRKISLNSVFCRTKKNWLNLAKIEVASKNDVEIEFGRICQNQPKSVPVGILVTLTVHPYTQQYYLLLIFCSVCEI
jgi:hypothetical protein